MKKNIFSILLVAVLVVEASAKQNRPSKVLSRILDQVFDNGILISEISYKSLNNLTNVELITSKFVERRIDGVGPLGIKMRIKLDGLYMSGKYNFQNFVIFPFRLFGRGKFSILLRDVDFMLNIYARRSKIGKKYYAKLKHIQLNIREAKVKFTKLFGSRVLSMFVNKLISTTLPTILKVLFREQFVRREIEKLYKAFVIGTDMELFVDNIDPIINEIPNITKLIEMNAVDKIFSQFSNFL